MALDNYHDTFCCKLSWANGTETHSATVKQLDKINKPGMDTRVRTNVMTSVVSFQLRVFEDEETRQFSKFELNGETYIFLLAFLFCNVNKVTISVLGILRVCSLHVFRGTEGYYGAGQAVAG